MTQRTVVENVCDAQPSRKPERAGLNNSRVPLLFGWPLSEGVDRGRLVLVCPRRRRQNHQQRDWISGKVSRPTIHKPWNDHDFL